MGLNIARTTGSRTGMRLIALGCAMSIWSSAEAASGPIGSAGEATNALQVGGLLLRPLLTIDIVSDSNIFADDRREESDVVSSYRGGAQLESNWDNHELGLFGTYGEETYADNSSEDADDTEIGAFGRLDINRKTALSMLVERRDYALSRNLVESTTGVERLQLESTRSKLELRRRLGVTEARLYGRLVDDNFDDSIVNPDLTNQRDRRTKTLGTRFTRMRGSDADYYLDISFSESDYDDVDASIDFDRSNNRAAFGIGKHLQLGGVVSGEFLVGYFRRDYRQSELDSRQGVFGEAELVWDITQLSTITGRVKRSFDETTLSNALGDSALESELALDHELLRSLRLRAEVTHRRSDFEGLDRKDRDIEYELSARYELNRIATISLFHRSQDRRSTGANAGRDYDSLMFGIGLSLDRWF